MANRRLANVKTKKESGLNYCLGKLSLGTPFGKKVLQDLKPFYPGEEVALEEELGRVETLMSFADDRENLYEIQVGVFMDMKDQSFTLKKSGGETLSVVELFEIKSLLLKIDKMRQIFERCEVAVPKIFVPDDVTDLLDKLDPRHDRLNTFYIYEEFSEKLVTLRQEKRQRELSLRKEQKTLKEKIKEVHGIALTPKFDCTVSRNDEEQMAKLEAITELEQTDRDYVSVTFSLKTSDAGYKIKQEIEEINGRIEEEETLIRKILSEEISKEALRVQRDCEIIGAFDFTLAKALYARDVDCVRPQIVEEHTVKIEEGRHLEVEEILHSKGKEYIPVSIELSQGVTCITGANMGGKTISLKLVALVAILAQYGFFVPCKEAKVGLASYMQMLIGDSQSLERGLSSFGSEMEELKEILDHSRERSLILIDEIASGTNPAEGTALTKSLIDYLKSKQYITLITTHLDVADTERDIVNIQVVGLANADFGKLNKEIRYANRKERIEIIGRYMDYRLHRVSGTADVPKDAINIAKMLGIDEEIISQAKIYVNKK